MNYISLSNEDIIIYNNIQTKVYKNFIKHYKTHGNTLDIQNNEYDDLKLYNISQNYCKSFKYNICLCYRNFKYIENIKENYNKYYKCINNKNILYNPNNFNFLNPLSFQQSLTNNKIFPLDITTYYRQEYIPYIVHNEFLKYKKNTKIIKIIIKNRLSKYFKIFIKNIKELNEENNIYYKELIDIFNPKNTTQTNLIIVNNDNNDNNDTPINYYVILSLLLNDYNKIIKEYDNLIMDLI